ncbi:hypothetical protein BGZ61DRAFT_469598 [Ilyonectria robusta]|uniref:uncharacterized protein n=1 Tax=Ilyonectria robusta TaxID=1079257 RepID=UPI001E8CF1E7|nr:uncharacterized protein BGZ61DRAFT_469598 [Ilyonectria robusta]KAH8649397.1 hypothetical protein BGZ61DRAFT_469598 [Ilyonectria robusta]
MGFTLPVQEQDGLKMIGVGASGQVYEIDENIVLKSGRVYKPPNDDTTPLDRWHYVSESIFHFELISNERKICQLLEQNPHPNLAEPISTVHAEGIYLRRYNSRPELSQAGRSQRISLYRDVLRGLDHLHGLGIAHSDLRMENVLFDVHGQAIVCDFSASAMFGQPNLAQPTLDCPVPLNGLDETVSDATDRFALESLMFHLETGVKPDLSIGNAGTVLLPQVEMKHPDIGVIIKKAWLGKFASTTEMLQNVESIKKQTDMSTPQHTPTKDTLQYLATQWRA